MSSLTEGMSCVAIGDRFLRSRQSRLERRFDDYSFLRPALRMLQKFVGSSTC